MKGLGLLTAFKRLAMFACLPLALCAQTQIQGTIKDASGLGVPGAEVKMTQTDTGAVRTATSGTSGDYVMPNLAVGPYRLETTKEGFSTYIQNGIVLQIGSEPTIDVSLKVGNVSEQVSVEANAALVETQTTGVGQVIENQRILELPLNGRNAVELVQLSAGAVVQGASSSRSFQGQSGGQGIAVAGGTSFGTTYMLDGAFHNNPYDNNNLPLPFPDALQEFKVEASSLTAQNGVHSGAAVNAVTKSGTNAYHGDAFEFVRNGDFNGRNAFAAKRDSLKRNQYGGTIGGPIIKNKLFWFGGYQGTITRQDTTPSAPAFIPTAAMLGGDFTTVTSTACTSRAITLGAPFVGNKLAPSLLDPVALKIAAKLPPTADQACGQTLYGTTLDQDEWQVVGRADYQINSKQSLFGRYIATTYYQPTPFSLQPNNILATQTGGRDSLAQTFTLGHTWLLSSSMVNSLRAAINRTGIHRTNTPDFGPADVGIQGVYSYQPDYMLMTVTNGFAIGNGVENQATFRTTTYQLGDDYSIVKGSHQFAFGAEAAHWRSNSNANVRSPGVYSFTGTATGLGLADFITGKLAQLDQSAPNTLYMKQWYFGGYAQDTWKITPHLTLNYGVRWEPWFPQIITNGAIYNFSLARFQAGVRSSIFKNAPFGFYYPGDPGFPGKSGLNSRLGDFGPRIGLAWDPFGDGKTSVRSSFGRGYDFLNAQFNLNTAVAPPWGSEIRTSFGPGGLQNPFLGFPGGNPFPITFNANAPFTPFGPFLSTDYDEKTTVANTWNLSIQRQIGSSLLVSANYVGNSTNHLWLTTPLNPAVYIPGNCVAGQYALTAAGPCSNTANVNQRRVLYLANPAEAQYIAALDRYVSVGNQSYNGLILSAQKRYGNSFSANVNYTWSHCLTNDRITSGGNTTNVNTVYLDPNNANFDRGNCPVDRRHILNFTGVAQVPKFSNRTLTLFASDWQLAAIIRHQSGAPLTITTTDRQLSQIGAQRTNQRVSDVYGTTNDRLQFLNPLAFSDPALGTLGNMSPGTFPGHPYSQIDASLSRRFRIIEKLTMDFRVDAFNLPNHVRFSAVSTSFSATNLGRTTGALDPRILQLSVKFLY
jgi:hypothetical protein